MECIRQGKNDVYSKKPWLNMSPRTATFKKNCSQIVINLRDILEIDTQRQIVRTEPLVDMGYMTRYLLPKGWALAIQVEMEDLTIGGLCLGLGMETNCHRYGLIQETVEAFEVITADGSLVRATRTENADLFYALPWSWGTIAPGCCGIENNSSKALYAHQIYSLSQPGRIL